MKIRFKAEIEVKGNKELEVFAKSIGKDVGKALEKLLKNYKENSKEKVKEEDSGYF